MKPTVQLEAALAAIHRELNYYGGPTPRAIIVIGLAFVALEIFILNSFVP